MNENNRSNYINAPARGRELQQQRAAAQNQYMQSSIPQSGYQQNAYAQQQAQQLQQQGYMPPQNPTWPQQGQQGWAQAGYRPAGMQTPQQGYAQPNAGYAQQGYPRPNGGYPQQGYAQQNGGYPRQGYPGQQPGYAPQGTGYQQPAGYAPQGTGYQQPAGYAPQGTGYQQSGYAPQGTGYQQSGYAPQGTGYQQPGYAPQGTGYQQPGYAPQNNGYFRQPQPGQNPVQPETPKPRRHHEPLDTALIHKALVFGVLPVLFIVAMVLTGIPALKWVFAGAAVLGVASMWILKDITGNTRMTAALVLMVGVLVAVVTALIAGGTADPAQNGPAAQPQNPGVQTTAAPNPGIGADSLGVMLYTETPTATPSANDGLNSEAVAQLKSFFYFWSSNQHDEMVGLCAPSWKNSVSEPNVALFSILANRTPLDYSMEKISGTDNDTTRTVIVTATIDKNKGTAPSKYRMSVVMLRENDMWYVDPRSLSSAEAESETPTPVPEETATPTPTIYVTSSTVLYYNPDGGSMYHADPNCQKVGEKYRPLKGKFTYGELESSQFKDLMACNVCNAPLRESWHP